MLIKKRQLGFGLLETITAMALFLIIVGASANMLLGGYSLNRTAIDETQAVLLAEAGIEAGRSLQNQNWNLLSAGVYGLDQSGGSWQLSGTSDTTDGYIRELEIESVERDVNGQIVATGGTVDPDTLKLTSRISWSFSAVKEKIIELTTYVTNWKKTITVGSIGPGLGLVCANQVSSGTNVNNDIPSALIWNQQTLDSTYYTFDSAQPTRISVATNGDYLMSLTLPMHRNDTANIRTRVEASVFVNGVQRDVGEGQSAFIRSDAGHSESSSHLHVLLNDLVAGDYVEIFTQGTADIDPAQAMYVSGRGCAALEFISDLEKAFFATATQSTTGTNINAPEASINWNSSRTSLTYTHTNGTSTVTFAETGLYRVYVNIPYQGAVTRANVQGQVKLNGTTVPGGIFQQGYVRNANTDTEASIHWSGFVQATAGQILTITVQESAAAGTQLVDGAATLFIQQLPTTGVYAARATALSSGSNWNPAAPAQILWQTDAVIDTAVYSHSTSSNSQTITILEAGDYILSYNDALTAADGKPNPRIRVVVNGTALSGAETKTHYIRGTNGHNESSASLVFLLNSLEVNDTVTIQVEAEADSDVTDDMTDALLLLWNKQYTAAPSPSPSPTPTPSPLPSPSPSPSPVPSPSPSPSPVPSPSPSPTPPVLTGVFNITSNSNSNFCGQFVITNSGTTAATNWVMTFTRDQYNVTSFTNMTWSLSGNTYTANPQAAIQTIAGPGFVTSTMCASKNNKNAGFPTNIVVTPL